MQPELYRTMREIEDRHWWFRARRRIVSGLLTRMQLPTATRLLDLGCGTGGNLSMLCRHGAFTGIESNPVAVELANARGVATVLAGRLPDDLPVEPEAFNCITLLDVLEHLQEDGAGLEAIHRLLAVDGRLLITVLPVPPSAGSQRRSLGRVAGDCRSPLELGWRLDDRR